MNSILKTDDLQKILAAPNPPALLDVRLEDDFHEAHLPRAIHNCVFAIGFTERSPNEIPEKNRPIVVYGANAESCEARIAAEKLRRAGYENVAEYRDGIASWLAAGGSVERGAPCAKEPAAPNGARPLNLAESRIEWRGRNLLTTHRGEIGIKNGALEFANGELTGGRIVIDMRDIRNFNLQGSDLHDVLIHHLQSDDFFDVARFPEATFDIHGSNKIPDATIGQPNLEIDGYLTLKNITAPLTFRAVAGLTPDGKAAAQAVIAFDRTRWNVLYGSGKFFARLGMHLVNDLIDLEIKIVTT